MALPHHGGDSSSGRDPHRGERVRQRGGRQRTTGLRAGDYGLSHRRTERPSGTDTSIDTEDRELVTDRQ